MIKHVDKGSITPSSSSVGGGYVFSLSELPEIGAINQLYEAYRIDKVTLHFIPTGNPANNGQFPAPLYMAFDQIVNTTPTALSTLLDYSGLKIVTPGTRAQITFRPRPAVSSGGSDSVLPSDRSSWISITNTSLGHYGLRYFIPSSTLYASSYSWRVTGEYHISLRGTF